MHPRRSHALLLQAALVLALAAAYSAASADGATSVLDVLFTTDGGRRSSGPGPYPEMAAETRPPMRRLRVVSCSDRPVASECLWRVATMLDDQEPLNWVRAPVTYVQSLEQATSCNDLGHPSCYQSYGLAQAERLQLAVLNVDNVAHASLEFLALPPSSHPPECKDALRRFKTCYDRTYDRLLRFNQRELCRRLEFHNFCQINTNVTRLCRTEQTSSLVRTDMALRIVLEELFCARRNLPPLLPSADPAEKVVLHRVLDYVAAQHSTLHFAITVVTCALDPELCGL